MTPEQLAAIEARVNAATPGSWEIVSPHLASLADAFVYGDDGRTFVATTSGIADAEFIAHAREDVPALIDRVRKLEAELTGLDFANISNVLEGGGGGSEGSSAQEPGKDR